MSEQQPPVLSRRAVVSAGAWGVPVIALAAVAPVAAASVDLSHVISAPGLMIIDPDPGARTNFFLDFNGGSTRFDASQIFTSPAGDGQCTLDHCGANDYILSWTATSSVTPPSNPTFTSGQNDSQVTVPNSAWGFDSTCSITVVASSISGYPPVTYRIDFVVTDLP